MSSPELQVTVSVCHSPATRLAGPFVISGRVTVTLSSLTSVVVRDGRDGVGLIEADITRVVAPERS